MGAREPDSFLSRGMFTYVCGLWILFGGLSAGVCTFLMFDGEKPDETVNFSGGRPELYEAEVTEVAGEKRSNLRLHPSKKCLDEGEANCPVCDNSGISIGMLYFNDEILLGHQLRDWASWSGEAKSKTEFIVVDTGSDEGKKAKAVISKLAAEIPLPPIRLLVFSIREQIAWNQPGGKNLMMHKARYCRVVMLDADHIFSGDVALAASKIDFNLYPNMFRLPRDHTLPGECALFRYDDKPYFVFDAGHERPCPYWWKSVAIHHPGVSVTSSEIFFSVGGMDEDFAGHYGDDFMLFSKAEDLGVAVEGFNPEGGFRMTPMPNDQDQARKRDSQRNMDLLEAKRRGEMAWSESYLRFNYDEHRISVKYLDQSKES